MAVRINPITAGLIGPSLSNDDMQAFVDAVDKAFTPSQDLAFAFTESDVSDTASFITRDVFFTKYGEQAYERCAHCKSTKNGGRRRTGWDNARILSILLGDFKLCSINNEIAFLDYPFTSSLCDGYYRTGEDNLSSLLNDIFGRFASSRARLCDDANMPNYIEPIAKREIDAMVKYVYAHAGSSIMTESRAYDRPLGVFITKDNTTLRITDSGISTTPVDYNDHALYGAKLPVNYNLPDKARFDDARRFVDDWLLSLAGGNRARRDRMVELVLSAPLLPSTIIPGSAIMYGHGNDGKSTLAEIMTDMLGPGHVFISGLKDAFGSDFGLEPAASGSHVLYVDEMPPNTIDPSVLAKMKTVTAGGAVSTKRKYKSTVSIPLLYVLACTNHPISFPVRDADLRTHLRRFNLVYFPHTLSEDEVDKSFRKDFVADEYKMSALLHVALDGVQRIIENQAITYVQHDADIMKEWIGESDSISAWLAEYDMFGEHAPRYSLIRSRNSRNYTCSVRGVAYAVDGIADDYHRAASANCWGTADFYLANEDRVVNVHDLKGSSIDAFGFSNETTVAYEQYKIWYETNGSNKPIALKTFVAEMKKRGYATKRLKSTLFNKYKQVTLFLPKDVPDMTQADYVKLMQAMNAGISYTPAPTNADATDLASALASDPRADELAGLIGGPDSATEPTPEMLRLGYELAVKMLKLAGISQ